MVKCHELPGRPPCGVAIAEGRRAHVVKPDGATSVRNRITPHVDRGPAHRVWPGFGLGYSGPCGCPVSFVQCSVSGSTIVLEGIV